MLSNKEEEEIDAKMKSSIVKYMKDEVLDTTNPSVENVCTVLTYRATANLVKHSKRLECLTWALISLTVVLGLLTAWSIFKEFILQFI